MKQPVAGILATVVIMAIALGFVSLFDFPTFSGWVAYYLLCTLPMLLVAGITWGGTIPALGGPKTQPAKGTVAALAGAVAGVIVAYVYFVVVGGSVSPPTPMLAQCTIASVAITFWAVVMFGGWPFTLIRNQTVAGIVLLIACYVINYILFRIFFNYGFMSGAPVYVASLDPGGMFNAWNALVFYISALSVMFLMVNFDLWPFTTSATVMKQPVLGIVWTLTAFVIGGGAYHIGVNMMGMDVVAFMVTVPVPFIFGTIVVVNMLQGSLTGKLQQPAKGIVNAIAAAVIGTVLAKLYGAMAPVVTGNLNPGPPTYDFEIWLASALLSVTFPFLFIHAALFNLWPFIKQD
jgi:hypothetical protein